MEVEVTEWTLDSPTSTNFLTNLKLNPNSLKKLAKSINLQTTEKTKISKVTILKLMKNPWISTSCKTSSVISNKVILRKTLFLRNMIRNKSEPMLQTSMPVANWTRATTQINLLMIVSCNYKRRITERILKLNNSRSLQLRRLSNKLHQVRTFRIFKRKHTCGTIKTITKILSTVILILICLIEDIN